MRKRKEGRGRAFFGWDTCKSPVSPPFELNASPSNYSGCSISAEFNVHTAAAVDVRPHLLSPPVSLAPSLPPQLNEVHGLGRAHRGRRSAFAQERRASLRRAVCQGRVYCAEGPLDESDDLKKSQKIYILYLVIFLTLLAILYLEAPTSMSKT